MLGETKASGPLIESEAEEKAQRCREPFLGEMQFFGS